MEKSKWMYVIAATAILSVTGCNAKNEISQPAPQKEAAEVNATDQTEIINGIKDVMQEVQRLDEYLKTAAGQDAINKFGKTIAQKWDEFEGEVENRYPDQYKKIEDNLYPLIAETGKPTLDVQKIKDLVQKVQQDLTAFLKQLQK
ncbi:hypothetical protein [Ectobacillus panaciterrae]|uniref:hypothetical protein n=1 Tax=Ectobacillus panaciterrae TaxID=363872 RepID=UPI0003F8A52A|nr:hypothetical protein [Ectobacillus panaciterrae]